MHRVGNARAVRRSLIYGPPTGLPSVPCLLCFSAPRSPRVFFLSRPLMFPPAGGGLPLLHGLLAQLASGRNFCVVLLAAGARSSRAFWPTRLPRIRAGFEHFSFFTPCFILFVLIGRVERKKETAACRNAEIPRANKRNKSSAPALSLHCVPCSF